MIRCTALLCLLSALSLYGQDSSSLSGSIIDPSGAVVPGAKMTLTEPGRKITRYALTNDAGLYSFDALVAGEYQLVVQKDGFKDLRVDLVRLAARDTRSLRLQLELGGASSSTVTVTAQAEGLSTDVSTGLSFNYKIAKDLPVNGRNIQSLVNLSPGVVSNASPDGGINTNGLRSNTNYYTVDGVSSTTAVISGGGGLFGAVAPITTGNGNNGATGQSNLITLDAMQELRVQTSAFAPEYGRTPGAQVSIVSRSGANDFHGAVFGYFRNQRFNANDWFANRGGVERQKMRQNNYGAVLGGKIIPGRTYFFLSYEQNSLSSPRTAFSAVPNLATRASATPALRPYLSAFPLPNGLALDATSSQYTGSYTNPSEMKSYSGRIDHRINSTMSAFVRYARTPSDGSYRGDGFLSANTLTSLNATNETVTGSWIWEKSEETTNDLRVNYTRGRSDITSVMDSFGGATPLSQSGIFPAGINGGTGLYSLFINGLGGYTIGTGTQNRQEQMNVVNNLSRTRGSHQWKFGVDYRRLSPTYSNRPYSASFTFNGLAAGTTGNFLGGIASNAIVSSNVDNVYPVLQNISAYIQDTWKLTDRTTFTYGVRWDVNPAPSTRDGLKPLALTDADGLVQGEKLYETRYYNFAPRFGVAYQLDNTPGKEMIFRGGMGIFYDIGYGTSLTAFSAAPFSAVRLTTQPAFPLNATALSPPPLPAREPFSQVNTADNHLLAPRILQWQAALERNFGPNQSLEFGYVGTRGRRMSTQVSQLVYTGASTSVSDVTLLRLTTNGAVSDYNGLNAQYRRRFARNLLMQANYTWSHAIDSASSDFGAGFELLSGSQLGDSSFDIRHNYNVSGSYRLPGTNASWLKVLTNHWWTDFIFIGRSALPIDLQTQSTAPSTTTTSSATRVGFYGQGRPNYNGLPVYVSDVNSPGGRRLNRAAFSIPRTLEQGNLGRNTIRGFKLYQLDFTLRRDIVPRDGFRIQLRLEAYNLLNHPNFANPTLSEGANLASPNFGASARMQNASLGGSNLYTSGGPRTMQAAIRFEF